MQSCVLDIPGLLQHVIVRGIELSDIFLDDDDRERFVDRFNTLLVETGTDCFAWALIPNHAHLLLRCNHFDLSRFMRKLLTGYDVMLISVTLVQDIYFKIVTSLLFAKKNRTCLN